MKSNRSVDAFKQMAFHSVIQCGLRPYLSGLSECLLKFFLLNNGCIFPLYVKQNIKNPEGAGNFEQGTRYRKKRHRCTADSSSLGITMTEKKENILKMKTSSSKCRNICLETQKRLTYCTWRSNKPNLKQYEIVLSWGCRFSAVLKRSMRTLGVSYISFVSAAYSPKPLLLFRRWPGINRKNRE